jgi:hypothetical protein
VDRERRSHLESRSDHLAEDVTERFEPRLRAAVDLG